MSGSSLFAMIINLLMRRSGTVYGLPCLIILSVMVTNWVSLLR